MAPPMEPTNGTHQWLYPWNPPMAPPTGPTDGTISGIANAVTNDTLTAHAMLPAACTLLCPLAPLAKSKAKH